MKLKLVKATNKYRNQIVDMLDEWNNSGEEIFHSSNISTI